MNNVIINCFLCNTPFEKFKGEYDRQIRNGKNKFFCSQRCVQEHIKNVTRELGKATRLENESHYYQSPKKCPQCNSIVSYDYKENKFCSQKCGATYTQKDGGHCHWSDEDKKRISLQVKEYHKNNPITEEGRKKLSSSLLEFYRKHPKLELVDECRGKYPHIHKVRVYRIRDKKIVKKKCKICDKEFDIRTCDISKRKYCSFECFKIDIKNGYLKGKSGGYRERGGRGKMGWYKGYFCHSTWELAWVIYNLEHNVLFVRNKQGFEYKLDGKKHKFYPDFIVNGEYVEIKGWDNGTVSAKLSQFPHKITVLKSMEMRPYLDYAKQKYGNVIENLYEKKNLTLR